VRNPDRKGEKQIRREAGLLNEETQFAKAQTYHLAFRFAFLRQI